MKKKSVQPPLDNNPPYLEEIAEQQQQKENKMSNHSFMHKCHSFPSSSRLPFPQASHRSFFHFFIAIIVIIIIAQRVS